MQRLLLCLLVISLSWCLGQEPEVVPPGRWLGYEVGERFTPHARIVDYVREVAERSDRVRIVSYGRTSELRPLIYAIVTSQKNQSRLELLKETYRHWSDPRLPPHDGAVPKSELPVVVWLSYNVHGNEASPSEAALAVLHRLATASDEETLLWLEHVVVILDPCINPDGRDRYVNWYNGVLGRRADGDLQSREHDEPWPGGRPNHYLFDLNRDWAFATQQETRSRHAHFVAWTPQVHVDFHEMDLESSYFFFPAEKPINANLPEHTLLWGKRFGEGNAKAFDARGWAYYTGEQFDLFYPGYGDSWPSFTGAIGMTYEQAGHGRAGALARRRDGTLLSLAERVAHHEVATYATIDTAAQGRLELLEGFREFRRTAVEEGRTGSERAFLIPPGADPRRADALVQTLLTQGIEVRKTKTSFTMERVKSSVGKTVLDRTFEAETYVIDLAQPLKRLAKTLLEPRTEIRELYFYDVSAWSLPLAFGTPAYESPVPVPVETESVVDVGRRPGGVERPNARVGWIVPYATRGAMEALVDLLRRRVLVRSAHREFTHLDRTFSRGTLVIRRHENASDVATVLAEVGKEHGISFVGVDSGYTARGIDLGSSSVRRIVAPRVALVGGEGVRSTSFGAAWFLLDQVLDLPHSVINWDSLPSADLSRYTAVVVPEGRTPLNARERLERFVEDGGVVLLLGSSAFGATGDKDALVAISSKTPTLERGKDAPKEPRAKWTEEREEASRRRQAPGSIFLLELDPSHPVSFGYRADLAGFKAGTRSFDPDGPGIHVALFRDAEPLSGYVNDADAKMLQGRSFLSVQSRGLGSWVLFADDPNFRGAWQGMTRLFLNAILLLPRRHVAELSPLK